MAAIKKTGTKTAANTAAATATAAEKKTPVKAATTAKPAAKTTTAAKSTAAKAAEKKAAPAKAAEKKAAPAKAAEKKAAPAKAAEKKSAPAKAAEKKAAPAKTVEKKAAKAPAKKAAPKKTVVTIETICNKLQKKLPKTVSFKEKIAVDIEVWGFEDGSNAKMYIEANDGKITVSPHSYDDKEFRVSVSFANAVAFVDGKMTLKELLASPEFYAEGKIIPAVKLAAIF